MGKNTSEKKTEFKDLRFLNFDLAKRLSQLVLLEMAKEKLETKDISHVLADLCKFMVIARAEVSRMDALDMVEEFTELITDITLLIMRISVDNYSKGIESLKEEGK